MNKNLRNDLLLLTSIETKYMYKMVSKWQTNQGKFTALINLSSTRQETLNLVLTTSKKRLL